MSVLLENSSAHLFVQLFGFVVFVGVCGSGLTVEILAILGIIFYGTVPNDCS